MNLSKNRRSARLVVKFFRSNSITDLLSLAIKQPLEGLAFILGSVRDVDNFLFDLAGINLKEAQKYMEELIGNRKFRNALNSHNLVKSGYCEKYLGSYAPWRMALYVIIRATKPALVVETGVLHGLSSAVILQALYENEAGSLFSIDLPSTDLPEGMRPGWRVPQYLKSRWELKLGKSRNKLEQLLEELGKIDIFLHDSEHTYKNMMWEYTTAWARIKKGGFLLSHDIEVNEAFSEFSSNVRRDYHSLGMKGVLGGIEK